MQGINLLLELTTGRQKTSVLKARYRQGHFTGVLCR